MLRPLHVNHGYCTSTRGSHEEPTAAILNLRAIPKCVWTLCFPVGKGIRGAPRDAIVADIAPEHLHRWREFWFAAVTRHFGRLKAGRALRRRRQRAARALARAAESCGRRSSASLPLPVSTSTNSPMMSIPSVSANRARLSRCASMPRPDCPCWLVLIRMYVTDGSMGARMLILYKAKLGPGMLEHHPLFRDAKATIWERISSGLAPSAPDVAMRRIISACL
jgi:hypothetical protein